MIDIKKIYKHFNVPKNIQEHMQVVAKLAEEISQIPKNKKQIKNKQALLTACLLHDVMKLHSKNHEKDMGDYIEKLGYKEVGDIIRKHKFDTIIKEGFNTIEEKILYYADKRVKHNKIVSLDERIKDGIKRYNIKGKELEKTKTILEQIKKLEKELL